MADDKNTWLLNVRVAQRDLAHAHSMLMRLLDHAQSQPILEPEEPSAEERLQRLPLAIFIGCATELHRLLSQTLLGSPHYRGLLLSAEHLDLVKISPPPPVTVDALDAPKLLQCALRAVQEDDLDHLAEFLIDAGLIAKEEEE